VKIGLVVYGSLDTLSGGYLYDRMLVRALRERGHTVTLFSLPWRNYPAHLVDNLRLRWARYVLASGQDLILQDELNHPSLLLLNTLATRHISTKQVAIVHHLRSSEDHPPARMGLYRLVERLYLRSVPAFICNSHTTQANVKDLRRSLANVCVAVPAADHRPTPSRATVAALVDRRANSQDPLHVLFVGNVIARKGLHTLVEALSKVDTGRWRLTIVGNAELDATYTASVKRRIAVAGLEKYVRWAGPVDDAALLQAYAAADLLAVPSYEGFGITYLEAMAFGLPVIASTAGAAHEIVTDGVDGYLIPKDDAARLGSVLSSLTDDRPLLGTLGDAARRRFEAHPTWEESMGTAARWLESI
jgi:glycosyltransferase involved in cell wall biosynthesis